MNEWQAPKGLAKGVAEDAFGEAATVAQTREREAVLDPSVPGAGGEERPGWHRHGRWELRKRCLTGKAPFVCCSSWQEPMNEPKAIVVSRRQKNDARAGVSPLPAINGLLWNNPSRLPTEETGRFFCTVRDGVDGRWGMALVAALVDCRNKLCGVVLR